MSKKLIAVAAAAALALTGLVGIAPANAAAITNVTITHGADNDGEILTASHTDADSAVKANTFAAARNVIFNDRTTEASTRTAVRFAVLTAAAGAVSVEATGGVRLATTITSAGSAIKVDAGSQTLTGATVNGALTYTFFAWNTSTTAGSVVIKTASSTLTYYVKGVAGQAYNITGITWPASLYVGQTDGKVTYNLTDAYGNHVASDTAAVTGAPLGGTLGSITYSTSTKLYTLPVATVTADNVGLQLTLGTTDLSANGFAKPVKTAFQLVSAGDLTAQVTSLTAQVTALTAQVAALQAQLEASRPKATSVTKKRFNTLARKWNAANPGSRVALKK
jgi:hypothetical protein